MRTKDFCRLVEAAILEEYGEEVNFDSVPFDHGEGRGPERCLGVFLSEGVHMAAIAARAVYILWQDANGRYNDEADKDEAMGDFCDIMGGLHIAPYMQWTCAYFPALTQEQVDAETDANEDPLDGSFVPGGSGR